MRGQFSENCQNPLLLSLYLKMFEIRHFRCWTNILGWKNYEHENDSLAALN